jgi:hypothetical protein
MGEETSTGSGKQQDLNAKSKVNFLFNLGLGELFSFDEFGRLIWREAKVWGFPAVGVHAWIPYGFLTLPSILSFVANPLHAFVGLLQGKNRVLHAICYE